MKGLLFSLVTLAMLTLLAWQSQASPAQAFHPTPLTGRMTGGGWIAGDVDFPDEPPRVTHGFSLHCDASEGPNRLQVNWGRGNRFHLENLAPGTKCFPLDEPVGIAISGGGEGRYNGVAGAEISFMFIDLGEPGTDDIGSLFIEDADGNPVLAELGVGGSLSGGNYQFHEE